jgi:hypothetical protein
MASRLEPGGSLVLFQNVRIEQYWRGRAEEEPPEAALSRRDEEIPDGAKTLGTLYKTTREKIELGWEAFESSTDYNLWDIFIRISRGRLYYGRENYLS